MNATADQVKTSGADEAPRGWLSLAQAAAHLGPGRAGRRRSKQTISDWIRKGLRGVRLKAVLRGGQWFTTAAWLDDFEAARTEVALAEASEARESLPPSPRSYARRTQAAQERNRKAGRS